MISCVRKCGAYLYRMLRKHVAIFLITCLIITMIIADLLCEPRRRNRLHPRTTSEDIGYRPGAFLKCRQPNNVSYCEFNYGLPMELDWKMIQVHSPPEMGNKSNYRVIYDAITGTMYANHSKINSVTYATQATPEFIYHIIEIARFWDGPISLAVFVPNYDLDLTIQVLNHLCHCYFGMAKVSLHLFYPKLYPPVLIKEDQRVTAATPLNETTIVSNITIEEILKRKLEDYKKLNNTTRPEYVRKARQEKIRKMMSQLTLKKFVPPILKFVDCSGQEFLNIPTFRKQNNMMYPINVGRNVARNASQTNYFLVSDVEMVPSDGLATKFLAMVRKLMGDKKRDEGCVFLKTIFVVPLFEVERGEDTPRDKDTLVRLVTANRATYFHQKVCPHCQRFPGLQSWLLRPSPKTLEPTLIARREYPYHRWEPLFFGTRKEPWYSESLSWEGRQDKMTQMLELCLQEYRMVVLDGGFLCHAAAPKSSARHARAEHVNTQRYLRITSNLKKKYPERPQCKISWRC